MSGAHIVAMGGGQWPDDPIYRFIFEPDGRGAPKVAVRCRRPSATTIGRWPRSTGRSRRTRSSRAISRCSHRTVEDLRSFVLDSRRRVRRAAGNTLNMLAIWRAHGLDEILREAWDAGVVLAGGSAGANCWFEASTTDSYLLGRADPLPDGLGFVPGSFCPHYDSEPRADPSSGGSSGKACCLPVSRATTSPRCTWWGPRSPRCWSRIRPPARGGSSRGSTATSSRPRSRRDCWRHRHDRRDRWPARARPTSWRSPAARRSRSVTTPGRRSRRRAW